MTRIRRGAGTAVGWCCALLLSLLASTADLPAAGSGGLHFERVGKKAGPPPEVITTIFQDRSGFIWIGSRDGLILYDGYSFVTFEHDAVDPASISDNAIRAIYEDRDGNLWVGTNTGGLNRLDRATWEFRHYRYDASDPRSLSHDSVYAILQDREGILWVGTQKGLNRFDPEAGTFDRMLVDPTDSRSISHDYIATLYEDRQGRLWVGTVGGGLNLRDTVAGRFVPFRHDSRDPSTIGGDSVFAVAEDEAGGLWFGTGNGVSRFDDATGTFRNHGVGEDGTGLSDPLVTSLAPGPPGTLWIGTHGGGLNELDIDYYRAPFASSGTSRIEPTACVTTT